MSTTANSYILRTNLNTNSSESYGDSFSSAQLPVSLSSVFRMTNGTSSGNINAVSTDSITLAAAATTTIDLTSVNLIDNSSGGFSNLKSFCVFITSTTGELRIGGSGSNILKLWFVDNSDASTIYPSSVPFLQGSPAGITVNSTNKNIILTNTHGSESVTARWVAVGVEV
jgi:hypothetical protein